METKDQRFAFMLSTLEATMLRELAEDSGESAGAVARRALRDAYRARFGDRKPKAK